MNIKQVDRQILTIAFFLFMIAAIFLPIFNHKIILLPIFIASLIWLFRDLNLKEHLNLFLTLIIFYLLLSHRLPFPYLFLTSHHIPISFAILLSSIFVPTLVWLIVDIKDSLITYWSQLEKK